ncbi:lytic transglycosylase domain-containing protein [Brucella abortus]|nr:lytic transglycosylase domain-containing protein [Brucella abortus]
MNQFIMTIAVLAVASILHAAVGVFAAFAADEPAPPIHAPSLSPDKPAPTVNRICQLIGANAEAHGIPKDFFARLIWKESRFDHNAVSPVGAQGIAQFMPYTAKERGLVDPFDVEQAIPASAGFLRDLKDAFGNWGLAAAAYNAGAGRVSSWMRTGGFLPLETEDYVLDITGAPADDFAAGQEVVNRPLDPKLGFHDACRSSALQRSPCHGSSRNLGAYSSPEISAAASPSTNGTDYASNLPPFLQGTIRLSAAFARQSAGAESMRCA